MNLSLKATRFVIEALEHFQKNQEDRLRDEKLSEDDASDLVNDRQYLEEIKHEFQQYHDSLLRQSEEVQACRT